MRPACVVGERGTFLLIFAQIRYLRMQFATQAEVMGSRAAWALGEWPALETFVSGEHMQARRHVVEEGQGVGTCLVLEAVVATQKGRLDEVRLIHAQPERNLL